MSVRHTKDRFILWSAIFLSLTQGLYFVRNGDRRYMLGSACFGVATIVLILFLKKLSRLLAGNLLVASCQLWLLFVIHTGVSPVPALFLLFTPMIAVMFADLRSSALWSLAVVALLGALKLNKLLNLGIRVPVAASWAPLIGNYFIDALSGLAIIMFFAIFYEGFLVRTLSEAERMNDELAASNSHLIILEAKARAETARAESLLRMGQTLLATLPVPVFIKDLDRRFIGCTTTYCDLVGYTREELLGRRAEDFFPAELSDVYKEHDDDLLTNGGRARFESTLVAKSGVVIPIEVFKSLYNGIDDKPAGIIGIFIDMSERRAHEERLQSLLQARDRILAILSHDLVNPLWGLKQTLELEDRPFTPETAAQFANEMELTVGAMHALLENILAWAKLQWHEVRANAEDFDIADLVRQETAELGRVPGSDAVRVSTDCPASSIVNTDRYIVRMLIRNLVSNALKYSLGSEPVEARVVDDGKTVRVTVSDRGPGIPEAVKAALAKGDATLAVGQRTGHGFGLALCRDFAAEIGAAVEFTARSGGGTVASFSIPRP